jgi:transcription termination factor NusB
MIKDFRSISFETIFNAELNLENVEIVKNKLAENQLLRCNQLIENTKNNSGRILNSIETYSKNWSYNRIGKVEKCTLTLGISELIMNLTPKKVIISEWVKITDVHSSESGAKFVNGILNSVSSEIE